MTENQFSTLQFHVENEKAERTFSPTPSNLYHQGGGESHLPQDNEIEKPPLVEPENLFSGLRRDQWTSI